MTKNSSIIIRGAKQHNLKNIDLELPRNELVVISGPSGSGKSSLAFDTIYAEAQRRFIESLSLKARQFLEQMRGAEVDRIEGLSPAIAIEQREAPNNVRSTVGTMTELYDYLRLLYAKLGVPFCPNCDCAVSRTSPQEMVDRVLSFAEGSKVQILAPLVVNEQGSHQAVFEELIHSGYVRVRVNGEILRLEDKIELDEQVPHSIEAVVDRLTLKSGIHSRLTDSVETALKIAKGLLLIQIALPSGEESEELFSEYFSCPNCSFQIPDLEPALFSFNSHKGACESCHGLGITEEPKDDLEEDLTQSAVCPKCCGSRLRSDALTVRFQDKNIFELCQLSIEELSAFFESINPSAGNKEILEPILSQIQFRLGFLLEVGVNYLALSRSANSLSGGEARRIRLAGQLGSGLQGVLYLLDEPSIGLHARDTERLLKSLLELRDNGNTVVVVEHDKSIMAAANFLVEMGPGAGEHGGEVVARGTPSELSEDSTSASGKYLSGELQLYSPEERRSASKGNIEIRGAKHHNLKNIDVDVPLGVFVCFSGVSGSGKSSLINETLLPIAKGSLGESTPSTLDRCERIGGLEGIDKVISIDQKPIGRTPRSNAATYCGILNPLRELFSTLPEARARGYEAGRFSFNVKGGRCEACQGAGLKKVEMHFLSDIFVRCPHCEGARYNRDTLDIRYKGKNISEILDMAVEEASAFFANVPSLVPKLSALREVGLGYLKLGQSATTLSAGEAQRVKLATELSRRQTGNTLYLLDEPTIGLHAVDVDRLLRVLHRLVDQGNSVVVIEHNLDVISSSDWVIDLGPEGGDRGGELVASGTPEELSKSASSHTGRALAENL